MIVNVDLRNEVGPSPKHFLNFLSELKYNLHDTTSPLRGLL